MIIELDDQFCDVDFRKNAVARAGIETICLSVARGEHFLIAERTVVMHLEKDSSFSHTTRGVLAWIRSEYSFIAGMLKTLRYKVKVHPSEELPQRIGKYQWVLPISHIAINGLQPTVLLGENSHDGDIYIHAGEHYRLESKYKEIRIRIAPRNGNGGGTSQELERISKDAREFCLCITDSDRLLPFGPLGTVAAACAKVADASDWVVVHDAPISRELENALPFSLVMKAMVEGGLKNWNEFQIEAERMGVDAVAHADLKFGTTLHWINRALPIGSQARQFWDRKADKALNEVQGKAKCIPPLKCEADTCTCVVVPRIAKDMASHVHEYMKTASSHEIFKRAKSSCNLTDWLRLGREVFEAGAGPRVMRL